MNNVDQVPSTNTVLTGDLRFSLAQIIFRLIEWHKLRQVDAAMQIRISNAKMSTLIKFAKDPSQTMPSLSTSKMLECIALLGCDVDIVIRKPRSLNYRSPGAITVVQA